MNLPQFFIYSVEQAQKNEALDIFIHPKDLELAQNRYQNLDHVKAFLFSRYCLRKSLSCFLGAKAWDEELYLTNEGKPFFRNEKWEFNLSHSKDQLLIGIHYGVPIGVDLEYMNLDIPYFEIAEFFMHPSEYEEFAVIPCSKRRELFYSLWVQKEAFLKMIGKGFQIDPCEIYIGFTNEKQTSLNFYCFSFKQNFRVGIVYDT